MNKELVIDIDKENNGETNMKCFINIDDTGKTNIIKKKEKIEDFFNLSKIS